MLFHLLSITLFCLFSVFALGDDIPIQHRIALLSDGMTVSWSTHGKADIKPEVRYGLNPNALKTNAKGITTHYKSSTTYFHHVELHELTPDTRYYWQVVTKLNTTNSPIHAFLTQPDVTKGEAGNFSVAIYGDMGIDNSDNTLRLLRDLANKKAVNLFWHVGYVDCLSNRMSYIDQIHWLIHRSII